MQTEPSLAIEATGLVKSFGEVRAVDGVDLSVRRGSISETDRSAQKSRLRAASRACIVGVGGSATDER